MALDINTELGIIIMINEYIAAKDDVERKEKLDNINAYVDKIAQDREVALARKVLGVSNFAIPRQGFTMKKRLNLLSKEMMKVIDQVEPDVIETVHEG